MSGTDANQEHSRRLVRSVMDQARLYIHSSHFLARYVMCRHVLNAAVQARLSGEVPEMCRSGIQEDSQAVESDNSGWC